MMMIAKPPSVGAVGRRLGSLGRRLLVSTTVLTPAALLLAAPAQADATTSGLAVRARATRRLPTGI
ncbi:MAG: hypothetical protein Q7T45_20720 [Bradyrhizobium sp.]|uniref:hypothetical protein n=1 Tax=Bradyrhizobium sp. TaxID=376 RepID=UPI00272394DE|nr:hypothetical protein [Bradyrhizobium sp.]MDO8400245.1 hypothetical protein [Bradyrhizobium sp.]